MQSAHYWSISQKPGLCSGCCGFGLRGCGGKCDRTWDHFGDEAQATRICYSIVFVMQARAGLLSELDYYTRMAGDITTGAMEGWNSGSIRREIDGGPSTALTEQDLKELITRLDA